MVDSMNMMTLLYFSKRLILHRFVQVLQIGLQQLHVLQSDRPLRQQLRVLALQILKKVVLCFQVGLVRFLLRLNLHLQELEILLELSLCNYENKRRSKFQNSLNFLSFSFLIVFLSSQLLYIHFSFLPLLSFCISFYIYISKLNLA